MEPQTQTQTQPTPASDKVDSTFPTQNLSNPKEENKVTNGSDTQHVDGPTEKDKVTTKSTSNSQTSQKGSTTENAQTQSQVQQDKKDDKIENKNPKQQEPEAKDIQSDSQSQSTSKPVENNAKGDQSTTRKASQTKEPKSNNSIDDKKDSQALENKNKKQSGPEANNTKADSQSQAKIKGAEKNLKTDQTTTRKDSQNKEPKSHESLNDKGSQINTGRSESLTNRDAGNKAVKTKSQEVKDKNPQVKSPTGQQNLTKSKQKIEEKPVKSEPTLEDAVSSIFNFFSTAKNKITESSSKSAAKFEEIVMKSPIVSTIRGNDYQAVITSDVFKKGEAKEDAQANSQKPQRSKVNRSQVKVPTKVAPEKLKKIQADKNAHKSDAVVEKPAKEPTARRTISKPKAKPQGSPSPVKAKNEVEEHIRLHKIEEIKKSKKVLQDKLDALNDQLFELQKPSMVYHENVSPTQVAFSMDQYKKIQREEDIQKKKEAKEFARKMLKDQKDLEQKREQRRDKNQALMVKEIDVLYQKQLNDIETLKGASSAKARFENNIKKLKDENMFSSLEQRKKDLKMVRSFHKHPNTNTDPVDQTNGEEANPEEEKKVRTKPYKKPLYVSPVLDQVLKEDEERKKTDSEKLQARKNLHKKQVEYGKEVKSSHLPQVHTAKYFDSDDKLTRAIHRSVNMEKNLVRLAGKDGLYSYLDKMKNKYPDLAKPRKDPANDSHPRYDDEEIKPKKSKAKSQQRHEEEDEEEEEHHQPEENWDLTDRTGANEEEDPRDSHPQGKGIKNLKGQGHQPSKRLTNQEINTPNDSRISERSRHNESQARVSKRHQVEQKDAAGADEDNEWEQELREDQEVLKNKIAHMLGDIKQMESQIKQKEQTLLSDMEQRKSANEEAI